MSRPENRATDDPLDALGSAVAQIEPLDISPESRPGAPPPDEGEPDKEDAK